MRKPRLVFRKFIIESLEIEQGQWLAVSPVLCWEGHTHNLLCLVCRLHTANKCLVQPRNSKPCTSLSSFIYFLHQRRLLESQDHEKQKKLVHFFLLIIEMSIMLYFRTRVILTAYKNVTAMPKEADVQNAKIFVGQYIITIPMYVIINILWCWYIDKRYEAIIIPIDGMAIPFHVSTVKVIYIIWCTPTVAMQTKQYLSLHIYFFRTSVRVKKVIQHTWE